MSFLPCDSIFCWFVEDHVQTTEHGTMDSFGLFTWKRFHVDPYSVFQHLQKGHFHLGNRRSQERHLRIPGALATQCVGCLVVTGQTVSQRDCRLACARVCKRLLTDVVARTSEVFARKTAAVKSQASDRECVLAQIFAIAWRREVRRNR